MFLFLKKSDPNLFNSSSSIASESLINPSTSPNWDLISSSLNTFLESDSGSFLFHRFLSFLISSAFPPIRISCFSASTNESPWSFAFWMKTIISVSELFEAFSLNSLMSWPNELKLTNNNIANTSLLNIFVKFMQI